MAVVSGVDFDIQTAEVLREEEYEIALVGMVDRGNPLPLPPDRTRWVFLKDLPPGLLQDVSSREESEGRPAETEHGAKLEGREEGNDERGRRGGERRLQPLGKDDRQEQRQHQHQHQHQQHQHQQRGASQRVVEAGAERTRGERVADVLEGQAVGNSDQRQALGEASQPTQLHQHSRKPESGARGAGGVGADDTPGREVAATGRTPPEQACPSSDTTGTGLGTGFLKSSQQCADRREVNHSNKNNDDNDNNSNSNNDNNNDNNGDNNDDSTSTADTSSSSTARPDDKSLPAPTPFPPAVPPPSSPPPPPTTRAAALTCSRYKLTIKPSICGGGKTSVSDASGAAAAGLGVFCDREVLAGDVVFEEDALLKVCRKGVPPFVWANVFKLTKEMRHPGVHPMDVLQAVAFDTAPPSVRRAVLRLYDPDERAFKPDRRHAWNSIIRTLDRIGLLRPSAYAGGSAARAAEAAGREGDVAGGSSLGTGDGFGARNGGGGRGGGGAGFQGGGGRLEADRRAAVLSKVMRICEANIFGEEGNAADGPRTLFELACRINHSCLPNCGYFVLDGRIVVRAMVDLAPGSELLVSYLSFEEISQPTADRRESLRGCKFFTCHCSRCDSQHDLWRGFRCPRCHKGVVRPSNGNIPRPEQQQQQLQQQQQQQQQQQSALPPCSSEADAGSRGGSGGGRGRGGGYEPLALGVSACTACGRVPTARWFRSAEALEEKLSSWLHGPYEELELPAELMVLKQACAVGVYLFAEHFLLCTLHREMAGVLRFIKQRPAGGEIRAAEVAYHLHQTLVGYDNMFGRPTAEATDKSEELATALFHAAIEPPAAKAVRTGGTSSPSSSLPSTSDDCSGTYAGLVLTPVPRFSTGGREPSRLEAAATRSAPSQSSSSSWSFSSEPGLRASTAAAAHDGERELDGGGDCAVCGRRHGDPARPVLGKPGKRRQEEEGRARGSQHRGADAARIVGRYKIVSGRELDIEEEEEARGGREGGRMPAKGGDGDDRPRPLAWSVQRRVYQEDCQRVLLGAIGLAVAVYGPGGEKVAELCDMLERIQEFIAGDP